MSANRITQPLTFQPLFMERVWGGRRLATTFSKQLPSVIPVGESWEIVDREEAQSVVASGPLRGCTLHQLWEDRRREIFGTILGKSERFPLLIKLLDATEKLSLQVHPPADVAQRLGGKPKTEMWYIAVAEPGAELYAGLRSGVTRTDFEQALHSGTVEELVHRIPVAVGDALFVPSGRLHAIGAGNLIVEVQQNSDTTYRVFDWNRPGTDGQARTLHIEESLRSIDFADFQPELISAQQEVLVDDPLFVVEKLELCDAREAAPRGQFAILCCLSGQVECAGVTSRAGEFLLVPAEIEDRLLHPRAAGTVLLRITIPPAHDHA